jgi:hypothetical protein
MITMSHESLTERGQAAGLDEHATDAQRDHAHRLHAELRVTPCSPRCAVWLLYGIQPKAPDTP